MKLRIAAALFAMSLPVLAQEKPAAAENLFYKAFYLEKTRDLTGAMALYEQFLAAAPDHKLAKEAATQQLNLLHRTGKDKEAEAFATKYEKLLGRAAPAAGAPTGAPPGQRAEAGGAPPPGAGPGGGAGTGPGPGGGRGAAQLEAHKKELQDQLAKAKESGNAEEVKKLEDQLKRLDERASRGGGGGGQGAGAGGPGGGRRGRGLFGGKKLTEMTPEELGQFKDSMGFMDGMVERMRENGQEDRAKQLETSLGELKKHLEANKLEDAQKVLDKMREAMGGRGRDR
jgi:tetratricopeptide (TPR) repeat protein